MDALATGSGVGCVSRIGASSHPSLARGDLGTSRTPKKTMPCAGGAEGCGTLFCRYVPCVTHFSIVTLTQNGRVRTSKSCSGAEARRRGPRKTTTSSDAQSFVQEDLVAAIEVQ